MTRQVRRVLREGRARSLGILEGDGREGEQRGTVECTFFLCILMATEFHSLTLELTRVYGVRAHENK